MATDSYYSILFALFICHTIKAFKKQKPSVVFLGLYLVRAMAAILVVTTNPINQYYTGLLFQIHIKQFGRVLS